MLIRENTKSGEALWELACLLSFCCMPSHFYAVSVSLLYVTVACDGGYVKLVNPEPRDREVVKDTLVTGRVEMCLDGEFRSICDEHWTNQEASVLCMELGFSEEGKKLFWRLKKEH